MSNKLEAERIYKAIEEGVYHAVLDAFGREGKYPVTSGEILKVIEKAIFEATSAKN